MSYPGYPASAHARDAAHDAQWHALQDAEAERLEHERDQAAADAHEHHDGPRHLHASCPICNPEPTDEPDFCARCMQVDAECTCYRTARTVMPADVRYRVCFVGALEDDGTAFDAFARFDCFHVHGSWAIGPAHAIADACELLGLTSIGSEMSDGDAFEDVYGIVLGYLQDGTRPRLDEIAEDGGRFAIWCEDEPAHATFCPGDDWCRVCGEYECRCDDSRR